MERNFTDHVYVELAEPLADALRQRCASRSNKQVRVFSGDCNSRAIQVATAMPKSGIALAFIDPTSWQIRFSTIERLTANRRVDLLISFFGGRSSTPSSAPATGALSSTWERMASRTSGLAHTAAIFASEVAGQATALLLRVAEVDVGRSTDEVKRLVAKALGLGTHQIATGWRPRQVPVTY